MGDLTDQLAEPERRIAALVERCKTGNIKLNKAWRQLREMDFSSQEWKEQSEEWSRKTRLLMDLALELNGLGFKDCLYKENGIKTITCLDQADGLTCYGCPSDIDYWTRELFPEKQIKLEMK